MRYFNKCIQASGRDLGQRFFSPTQKDSKILEEYLSITLFKRKAFVFLLEIQNKVRLENATCPKSVRYISGNFRDQAFNSTPNFDAKDYSDAGDLGCINTEQ